LGSETDRLAAELERLSAEKLGRFTALHATHSDSGAIPPQREINHEPAALVDAGGTVDEAPPHFANTTELPMAPNR
jgi:hypothetical protein